MLCFLRAAWLGFCLQVCLGCLEPVHAGTLALSEVLGVEPGSTSELAEKPPVPEQPSVANSQDTGTRLEQFDTPAGWNDFAHYPDPAKELLFRQHWSDNLERWTEYGIVGNPWTGRNDDQRTSYFNPLKVDIPDGALVVTTRWPAFPHRLVHYGGKNNPPYSKMDAFHLADFGVTAGGRGFPMVADNPCAFHPKFNQPWNWGPPRGWCDEYCEWSVRREGEVMKRIDFTCENPEYWDTLWKVDPELVRALIQDIVSYPVRLEDLYLRDAQGQPVVDVATGRPALDPLNKWNSGTHSLPDGGGAIHLTSPPNSLGAEIYLAAAASILREEGGVIIRPAHNLICCSQYGGLDRNSDPHIGQNVNQAAYAGFLVSLQNPVGLYIQDPDFTRFELPADKVKGGITAKDCWRMTRGYSGGYGLHAVFEIPKGQDFEINDIKIDGVPVSYAGQIAETFEIGLHAVAIGPGNPPTTTPGPQAKPRPCVWHGDGNPPGSTPQPAQPILGEAVFMQQNLQRQQLSFSPPRLQRGIMATDYALPCAGLKPGATVEFVPGGVTAKVVGFIPEVKATLRPAALRLEITVASDAQPGNRGVIVRNPGDTGAITPAPGMLEILP